MALHGKARLECPKVAKARAALLAPSLMELTGKLETVRGEARRVRLIPQINKPRTLKTSRTRMSACATIRSLLLI